MKHRRSMKVDGGGRKQSLSKGVECIGDKVAVTQHHSLGAAGRAAGVEDTRKIAAGAHCIWHRVVCQERFMALHSARRIAIVSIDQRQGGKGFRKRHANRCESSVDEQDARPAVPHGVLVLRRTPPNIQRHDHRTEPGSGEVKFQIPVRVQ
jgi:hypothetical protein